MVHCQNCGNINNQGSNFCRFCGTKIVVPPQTSAPPPPPSPPHFYQPQPQRQQPPPPQQSYENNPPRPYSWKTDEYQTTNARARKTQNEIRGVQPLGGFNQPHQPPSLVYQQQQQGMTYGYRCPRCGTQNFPVITKKISTAGWIVFAVLLIFTFFFFWIGLLMKEEVRVCPVCGLKVG